MENKVRILFFLLGFFSCAFLSYIVFIVSNPLLFTGLVIGEESTPRAPQSRISNEEILILEDKIILSIENTTLVSYEDSDSMSPLLNNQTKGIRIKPGSESELFVGDIISFRENGRLIVHRIIEIGMDVNGTYFVTRGDNSSFLDRKIRFNEIEYVTIGILW